MVMKIIINGAFGKVGTMLSEMLPSDTQYSLLARLGKADDLAQAIQKYKPDVVIDVTSADSVYQNARKIIDNGARPLIGTSGLTEPQIQELQTLCKKKKLGGIIAPNFSLGAILLMKYSQEIANYFPQVEIIEMHHDRKKDAPSGTAIKTAEMIAENKCKTNPKIKSEEILKGANGCKHKDIAIHSLRLPGFVARQDVVFSDEGETLMLSHNLIDRKAMLPGVSLALQKILKLDHLIYGLEKLL